MELLIVVGNVDLSGTLIHLFRVLMGCLLQYLKLLDRCSDIITVVPWLEFSWIQPFESVNAFKTAQDPVQQMQSALLQVELKLWMTSPKIITFAQIGAVMTQ